MSLFQNSWPAFQCHLLQSGPDWQTRQASSEQAKTGTDGICRLDRVWLYSNEMITYIQLLNQVPSLQLSVCQSTMELDAFSLLYICHVSFSPCLPPTLPHCKHNTNDQEYEKLVNHGIFEGRVHRERRRLAAIERRAKEQRERAAGGRFNRQLEFREQIWEKGK